MKNKLFRLALSIVLFSFMAHAEESANPIQNFKDARVQNLIQRITHFANRKEICLVQIKHLKGYSAVWTGLPETFAFMNECNDQGKWINVENPYYSAFGPFGRMDNRLGKSRTPDENEMFMAIKNGRIPLVGITGEIVRSMAEKGYSLIEAVQNDGDITFKFGIHP